jgi:hypothetical protein
MTEILKAIIANADTGEITERPLTANEILEREAMALESVAQQAELAAKADARQSALAKLAALGLTQDEINAL